MWVWFVAGQTIHVSACFSPRQQCWPWARSEAKNIKWGPAPEANLSSEGEDEPSCILEEAFPVPVWTSRKFPFWGASAWAAEPEQGPCCSPGNRGGRVVNFWPPESHRWRRWDPLDLSCLAAVGWVTIDRDIFVLGSCFWFFIPSSAQHNLSPTHNFVRRNSFTQLTHPRLCLTHTDTHTHRTLHNTLTHTHN